MRLVVYTAITGGFGNDLRPPINYEDPQGREIEFVCFSDGIYQAPDPWKLYVPLWEHDNPRRTARYHKVMPHRVLPDAEFWLWHDGNQQLKTNPWGLVDAYLDEPGSQLATYKHPQRDCVYQEHEACLKLGKDDPATMASQIKRYRDEGYPEHNGMIESTVVLRANTPAIKELNEAWWREIRDGSLRDQLSFNYVATKLKLPYSHVAGQRDRPVYFDYFAHR
jgi:hypothetical protein